MYVYGGRHICANIIPEKILKKLSIVYCLLSIDYRLLIDLKQV